MEEVGAEAQPSLGFPRGLISATWLQGYPHPKSHAQAQLPLGAQLSTAAQHAPLGDVAEVAAGKDQLGVLLSGMQTPILIPQRSRRRQFIKVQPAKKLGVGYFSFNNNSDN